MKVVEEIKNIKFTCDNCKAETIDNSKWFNIDSMVANWTRLFEKKARTVRYETKHLVDRVEINFCCKECAFEYLKNSIKLLLSEISPVEVIDDTVIF